MNEGNQKKGFKEFFQFLRENKDYLLSHHPDCSKFEDDCYRLFEKKLCVGCFTAYPIALLIVTLWLFGLIDVPTIYSFSIGLISGILQFLSLTSISDNKLGKISIKIFLGIGIGFFTIGIFSLPLIFFLRLLLFLLCINVAGLFSFLRMRKIKNICRNCEYNKKGYTCPGFEN